MSGLDEARRKIEERRAQQATSGAGMDLWMRENDLVIAHSLFSGEENDPYFDTYVSHEYPATTQGQFSIQKYCPVLSGHDENYACEGCSNNVKTKDRMIMWFWVYDILHTSLRPNETFPKTNWNGKEYFKREVNGPKVWETSAWRESSLDDIVMLGAQLGNVQKTRINLMCTGANLSRRYKFYMEPGSPALESAIRDQGQAMIRPVVEVLRDQLVAVNTVANPNVATSAPAPASNIPPYAPAAAAQSTPYTPPSAPPTPAAPTDKKLF